MKKSELKEYIKTRVKEAITVKTTGAALTPQQKSQKIDQIKRSTNDPTVGTERNPVEFVKETNIKEMARRALLFQVDPDFREKAKSIRTGGPIGPAKLARILDILDDKDIITGPEIAAEYGGKMPLIYPVFKALIDVGALNVVEKPKQQEPEEDEDDDIIDDKPKVDDEDSNIEFEPDEASIEKTAYVPSSVAEKAASFTLDNDALIQSIIRAYKDSRSKIRENNEPGDLNIDRFKQANIKTKESSSDKLKNRVEELVDKISELEPEIQAKVIEILKFKFKSVNAESVAKAIASKLGLDITGDDEIIYNIDMSENFDDENFTEFDPQVYERFQKLVNYK
jgi:hypothetical protein